MVIEGSGATSDIISGINFVVDAARLSKRPSVLSMSLGGSPSRAIDQAVIAAVNAGVHVVVAAGNENQDAKVRPLWATYWFEDADNILTERQSCTCSRSHHRWRK